MQFTNRRSVLISQLKKLGFICEDTPIEKLREKYQKTFLTDGYLQKDIDIVLTEEYNNMGIDSNNKYAIKKLRNKLIHIDNYIRFLDKKISRTS